MTRRINLKQGSLQPDIGSSVSRLMIWTDRDQPRAGRQKVACSRSTGSPLPLSVKILVVVRFSSRSLSHPCGS